MKASFFEKTATATYARDNAILALSFFLDAKLASTKYFMYAGLRCLPYSPSTERYETLCANTQAFEVSQVDELIGKF